MRVVALISGGKDSCYNMIQCVNEGHDIVALANLRPEGKDELDSYMYQTVGHRVIDLYAEAMGLPLVHRTIRGQALCQDSVYVEKSGDEVEDLFQLLKDVMEKYPFDGVASGAILSNYQRVRVEHVCSRLGVQSLAYLWQRNQVELLDEMINVGMEAILIKVAALGLEPYKHLGKSLKDMRDHLHTMKDKFDLNVCGEGGEYETMTLDCPLFLKKIVIDESELVIHSDDAFAKVGYLTFKKMHLEEKGLDTSLSLSERLYSVNVCKPVFDYDIDLSFCLTEDWPAPSNVSFPNTADRETAECSVAMGKEVIWISNLSHTDRDEDIKETTKQIFAKLDQILSSYGTCLKNIILVHLYCSDMSDFTRINEVYKTYFPHNPPARVCVQVDLKHGNRIQIDCLVSCKDCINLQHLHVQSISHWAPANIGPYSQAVKMGSSLSAYSGSIGLQPSSMRLVPGGITREAPLSLHHVATVAKVIDKQYDGCMGCITCYVTRTSSIDLAKKVFLEQSEFSPDRYLAIYVVVPSLPKSASVEWHVMTHPYSPDHMEENIFEDACSILSCKYYGFAFCKINICTSDVVKTINYQELGSNLMNKLGSLASKMLFARIFIISQLCDEHHSYKQTFQRAFTDVVKCSPSLAFIPVTACEEEDVLCTIFGYCELEKKHSDHLLEY